MQIDSHLFRQADFISVSIDNLMAALRDGAILVIAIVFVFLISVRATLITLIAIPLSLVAAILAMKATGGTINTMTLGGMAIALGALVDDAIIVVENIVRRLRENSHCETGKQRSVFDVVLGATREIQGSIVFATLIIMLVFLPLFFLSGVESRLMQPRGFAYVVSLAASLLVAITVTPVLSYWWLSRSRTVRSGHESHLSRGRDGTPYRPRGTGPACSGYPLLGDGSYAAHGRSQQAGITVRPAARSLCTARHEHRDRPTHLSPH